MDLLLELLDLLLAVVGVEGLLHLLLQMDLALPEQYLLLGLDDLGEQLGLLIFDPVDLDLQVHGLLLHVLELLDELGLDVVILVVELGLLLAVLGDLVVQPVHLRLQVLQIVLNLRDLLLVLPVGVLQSQLLLLQN